MTASKSLPARPSLESLRKQAKRLARDVAAGDAGAIARARAQLPHAALPLSRRSAQLVLAREYGFAGWQDLTAEVSTRLGDGVEWAAAQARRVIHDNDVERLKQLLAEYPAWLSWHAGDDGGGLLGMATSSRRRGAAPSCGARAGRSARASPGAARPTWRLHQTCQRGSHTLYLAAKWSTWLPLCGGLRGQARAPAAGRARPGGATRREVITCGEWHTRVRPCRSSHRPGAASARALRDQLATAAAESHRREARELC